MSFVILLTAYLQTREHVDISNMVKLFPCMVKIQHGTKLLFIL